MADQPILFDKPFPECQVCAPYKKYHNKIMGTVIVTGGFNEPHGHGYKRYPMKAIGRDGKLVTVPPGPHNIGFDYTKGFGSDVIAMYSGKVIKAGREGGYGYRVHIELDQKFNWQGKSYTCYQAYAHNSKILKRVGSRVAQGDAIAIEAGHGSTGPRNYGSHVDLDTYFYLNGSKVRINFELLAGGIKTEEFIERIEVMDVGTSGADVKWLELTLGLHPTGKYTEATKEQVMKKQASLGILADGIAGEDTCRELDITGFALITNRATIIKAHPIQSTELPVNEKITLGESKIIRANWIQDKGDHWLFECTTKLKERHNWYAFKEHVDVCESYERQLEEEDLKGDNDRDSEVRKSVEEYDAEDLRWIKALKECRTTGCGTQTAKAENTKKGVEGSYQIAKKDVGNLDREKLDVIREVGNYFNVPYSLIVGLASRESHIGAVLGLGCNATGWGDNNRAFGVLQVDRRYHKIKGNGFPFSKRHVRQAVAIFAKYRDQLQVKFPEWTDSEILMAACCAYNAGVSNVRTLSHMNKGTTNNDYGFDVIARSQFYLSFWGE